MDEYLRGIKLTDRESYNLLFKEFPDYTDQIQDVVKGFLSMVSTIDEACSWAREAIYLSSAGKMK